MPPPLGETPTEVSTRSAHGKPEGQGSQDSNSQVGILDFTSIRLPALREMMPPLSNTIANLSPVTEAE